MTRQIEPFPVRDARDPRTDPRVGDVLSDGRYKRTIIGWGRGGKSWISENWTAPQDASFVRYSSRRSRAWMPWDDWMGWAAGCEVVETATDPALGVHWHEQRAGVHRVEQDGALRTLHFRWGYAVVDGDVVALHGPEGEPMIRCRIQQHRWTPIEIAILYFGITHGLAETPKRFRLHLVDDGGEE